MPKATQLSLNLSAEISELYARLRQAAGDVLATAIKIGEKLTEADGVAGFDFETLDIPEKQQANFRRLYERRDELTEQLFFDLLSVPEVRQIAERQMGPEIKWTQWTGPINSLTQWVRKREAEMPVTEWPPYAREALRDRLTPLVELYQAL